MCGDNSNSNYKFDEDKEIVLGTIRGREVGKGYLSRRA